MNHKSCGGPVNVVERCYRASRLIRIDEDGSYEYDDETGQTFDVDETWLACSACDKQLSDDEVEAD